MRDAFAHDTGETAARNAELCPRTSNTGGPMPVDGLAALTFNAATNRITTAGFQYDAAGNQTQTVRVDGSLQRFQYDAANRLVKVFDGNGYALQSVTYGATNQRLVVQDGDNYRTYYAGDLAEYAETPNNPTTPQWSQSYIYLSGQLLSTITPNGAGETTQYHHPDRLGTRLITNSADTSTQEQATLPYGTALDAESTGVTNRRFTSYDRSAQTGLDYALNRHYDSQQGRFTQADPIGMSSSSLSDPQSLNMFSYVGNEPINRTDPSGLFWGKLFRALGKIIKIALVTVGVALAVLAVATIPLGLGVAIGVSNAKLALFFALASGAAFGLAYGPPWLKRVIGVAGRLGSVFGGVTGTPGFNPGYLQETPRKIPLRGWRLKFFTENIAAARKRLYSKKCTAFFKEVFGNQGEIAQANVLITLNNLTPYDGTLSTITQGDAGFISKAFYDKFPDSAAKAAALPVNQAGAARRGLLAQPGAANSRTRYDVYLYRRLGKGVDRFTSSTLTHEALHSFLGLGEGDLLKKLGGDFNDPNEPGISRRLRKAGC